MRYLFSAFVVLFFLFPTLVFARIPDDPYVKQWSYNDVGLYEAWDYFTGSKDVVVAIIDNGFDTFHPDLFDNVWVNKDEIRGNGIDDDNNGYVDDIWGWNFVPKDTDNNGYIDEDEWGGNNDPRPDLGTIKSEHLKTGVYNHATVIAGIIGAKGNNELAGAGVNWNVRLMNIKVVDSNGVGTIFYVPKAIRYAVDNGADVINISLVGTDSVDEVKDSIQYAYDHGVVVIAAAGNNSINLDDYPFYPICSDAGQSKKTVLGVSAIQESHYRAFFSNLGASCIDITAPGQDVSSTVRFSPMYGLTDQFTGKHNGTSFAAPFVSGAAALIKGIQPTWNPTQIFHALISTVHKTPPKNEAEYTSVFGAGLLQIHKAVVYALSQLQSTHPIQIVHIFNQKTGQAHTQKIINELIQSPPMNFLKNVNNATAFTNNGAQMYATVKTNSSNISTIKVYDASWYEIYSWDFSTNGSITITVGDVLGSDGVAEIVVSPTFKTDWVFKVFSLEGKQLNEYILDGQHDGVDVSVLGNPQKIQHIIALFKQWGSLRVTVFDSNFKKDYEFSVDFLDSAGIIRSGDVDGNGTQDIVVAGGFGEEPWVAIYTDHGELVRRFWGFDPEYRGGLVLGVGDYNVDGADDILVAKPGRVQVFSSKIEQIGGWDIPESVGKNMNILLY